MTFLGKRLMSG